MILESLTFKYIVELFQFFKVNKLDVTSAKISFLDVDRSYFMQFTDYDSMNSYYNANYKIYDKCTIGKYVSLAQFKLESSLYEYEFKYTASDICSNYNLRIEYPYDNKRLALIENYINKQKFLIDKNVSTYCTYSSKFKDIYLYEVYSPCYAEPSWNEGTHNIKTYQDLVKINDYKVYKN